MAWPGKTPVLISTENLGFKFFNGLRKALIHKKDLLTDIPKSLNPFDKANSFKFVHLLWSR